MVLYIYSKDNYIALDKCDKEGSNLICRIQSDRLEENLGSIDNNVKYTLNIMNEKLRNRECKSVFGIYFKIEITKKRDVYIRINNLKDNLVQSDEYFSYETKYNGGITNLKTDYFTMEFEKDR